VGKILKISSILFRPASDAWSIPLNRAAIAPAVSKSLDIFWEISAIKVSSAFVSASVRESLGFCVLVFRKYDSSKPRKVLRACWSCSSLYSMGER